MRTFQSFSLLLGAALVALTSCAKLGSGEKKPDEEAQSPFGASGIPPQLRAKSPESGTPVTPGGNAPSANSSLKITPEEDIVFTDPDNPDATLPELATLLAAPKRRGPWEESETIAKQRAAREGKPLLIWFTDSATSPMCRALSQELFNTPDFQGWAAEKLIRLKVDAFIDVHDPDLTIDQINTRRIDMKNYVARLKKQYKILGQPSLVLLNPSGEVVGRYRGYKRGDAQYFWGLIKHGEAVSANAYKEWRSGLEKKGYREWEDRNKRKVFARLTSYSNGTLNLIEPDGTRSRTEEGKLSDKDRDWITEQKKLRNMQ
ncbi:MAG: thioredoxin family protein [Gloeobacteraceae cyanobacterium ES-bin-144]|nr:thioredoxin family protein [Verrucomicrobiales bacterium]